MICICMLAYLRSRTIIEKLLIVQLLKNFPAFYGSQKFITVFTRALHWSLILIQIDSVHTIPFYLSKIYFNIVHLPTSWSSQRSYSFWLSHQYPIRIPLVSHSCYMSCYLILLDLIILIIFGKKYKL
jgi:hypothetical protein